MITEVRIEIGTNRPLLLSVNLEFIKSDPNHPKFIRLVYNDRYKNCKIESIHSERKDIIIEETQQMIEEICHGWKRTLSLYEKQQPQLVDELFNGTTNVRIYKNDEKKYGNSEGYNYRLEKFTGNEYMEVQEEMYRPTSDISSPKILEKTPEIRSADFLGLDLNDDEKLSTISSIYERS